MAKVKLRLLVSRAGTDFAQSVGEEIEVDKDEAERMIAAEQAVPVGKKVERATREPPEKR